jgi:DNA modification methylase
MSDRRNSLEWETLPPDSLKPPAREARLHPRAQIEKIKKSLRTHGQVLPILVDSDNVIIDGHAVWLAARELGAEEIAVVRVCGRSAADKIALRLLVNRVADDSVWNQNILRDEFEELLSVAYDLELTGFDAPEIDHVLDLDVTQNGVIEDASEIPPLESSAVTRVGDVWKLGPHIIGCGDALDRRFVEEISKDCQPDCGFTDPPYNVPIDGHATGKGRIRHREFAQAAGEMSSAEYQVFLRKALEVINDTVKRGAILFCCIDWRHAFELLAASRECELELLNICVWCKSNAGLGSLYRSQHEFVFALKVPGAAHLNNIQLGRHGRNRSNVWSYRGLNAFGADRDALLASHPTVKPVAMVADALRDVTRRGCVVIDPFLGSGTTLIAAEEIGRSCLGIEADPAYVDVAVRRWQKRTGRDAVHSVTQESFAAYETRSATEDDRD